MLPPPCCRDTAFPNMVRGVTFPSHAWGIQPITSHWTAGQSEHTSLFRTMSFVKIDTFQKGATIMYGMWKIMCFLNLKPKLLRKVLEINTFIMQGCVKLIKSNSKDIYNVQNISVYILKIIEIDYKKCFLSTNSAYQNDFWRNMWHWRLE